MKTITADSNRYWILKHPLKFKRYLRRNHKLQDRETVGDLIFNAYPDEGRKLIENFSLSDFQKKLMFINFVLHSPQIACLILSDQRQGKDSFLCKFFEDVLIHLKDIYPKSYENYIPRIVTLGNMKNPPFVNEDDMYFSLKSLPVGTREQEVWIYSSEIETVLPARGFKEKENTLYSQLSGTFAQNHQKIFGCSKLASKVDINFIRDCNCKVFKFISREKLAIEGAERENILSELGYWLLPRDRNNKRETLLSFDNQLFTVNYDLPFWWSDEYSEQFKNISITKIWNFVDAVFSDNPNPANIQIAVAQKFRVNLSIPQIKEHFNLV